MQHQSLGVIERIDDLRTIWPHEAYDFSKWLASDSALALLSEAVDIDIVLEERESSVGEFSVDIFATEEGSSRRIIIENQLEHTNHDHLGKIITYAAGKDAEVIIWIVKHARDEHKKAIEWLNQHVDENIGFFLIEIELWKIGDSLPAPNFNVVERPNDWGKIIKTSEGLSDRKKLYAEFWQSFNEYVFSKKEFNTFFSKRKPQPQSWYDLSVGNSLQHIALCVSTQKKQISADIYISDDKELFENYKLHAAEISQELGVDVEWRIASKACRILIKRSFDINDSSDTWPESFDWFIKSAIALRSVVRKYSL